MIDFSKRQCLVVDDFQGMRTLMRDMLRELGVQKVDIAATGTEAIAAYRACRPDVVTMDITMPDMDGIEATRRIMAEFPDAKIVMVTSHGQEKMVLDALKAGAKGYVLKPFDGNKVSEAIQKACKRVVLKDKLPTDTPTAEPAEGDTKPA